MAHNVDPRTVPQPAARRGRRARHIHVTDRCERHMGVDEVARPNERWTGWTPTRCQRHLGNPKEPDSTCSGEYVCII